MGIEQVEEVINRMLAETGSRLQRAGAFSKRHQSKRSESDQRYKSNSQKSQSNYADPESRHRAGESSQTSKEEEAQRQQNLLRQTAPARMSQ